MKLRQKLAAVLAATMVVTAVPVVTMAASTNRITHVAKVTDGSILEGNVAPNLVIELKDGITTSSPIYIKLQDASFEDEDGNPLVTTGDITVTDANGLPVTGAPAFTATVSADGSELAIQYNRSAGASVEASTTKGYKLDIPMNTMITGSEAKAFITDSKWVTGTEEKGIVFATTKEGTASIKVPTTVPSFYTEGGKVATITLEEDTIGALKATRTDAIPAVPGTPGTPAVPELVTFTLEFNADDFKIDDAEAFNIKFSRGFRTETLAPGMTAGVIDNTKVANKLNASGTITGTVPHSNISVSKDEIKVTVPATMVSGDDIGRIEISGVKMKSTERKPSLGEITVSVDNDAFSNEDVVVANVAEYGVTLVNNTKEEKAVEMVAGRKEKVKFTLKEAVDSTLTGGRDLEFTLDQGYFTNVDDIKVKHKGGTQSAKPVAVEAITDKDGNITGFSIKTPTTQNGVKGVEDLQIDAIEVEAEVILPMDKSGDITVKAAGRALGEDKELVIATATSSIKVETEGFAINTGIKEQKGGKVVITETDKGMIEKGSLEFVLPAEDGITFTAKPKVEVKSGDIKLDLDNMKLVDLYKLSIIDADDRNGNGIKNERITITIPESEVKNYYGTNATTEAKYQARDKEYSGTKVVVPVTRQSKEASVIEVTEIAVKLGRSVPTGSYDLKVAGSALGTKGNFNQKGFFEVGIKSEDAGEKVVTTISKDATKMVVNGVDVELAAPAYINGNKLMAPLRAVANAFGFNNESINYNSATKEILVRGNGSVVKLTIGSKEAFVDGTPITLASPAEIKAESTYVPVGDLARLLGITVEWDGATKTATFKN